MLSPRSSRPCRQLAVCLVLIAALLVTTAPVQASPGGEQGPRSSLSGLVAWFHGLLLELGFAPAELGDKPKPVFLPEGTCIDPNGAPITCPKLTVPGWIPPAKTEKARSTPLTR